MLNPNHRRLRSQTSLFGLPEIIEQPWPVEKWTLDKIDLCKCLEPDRWKYVDMNSAAPFSVKHICNWTDSLCILLLSSCLFVFSVFQFKVVLLIFWVCVCILKLITKCIPHSVNWHKHSCWKQYISVVSHKEYLYWKKIRLIMMENMSFVKMHVPEKA